MANLFDRLGYNFTPSSNNAIIEFSETTLNHLNSVPQLLTSWQVTDLVENNVGGYIKNPVANVITYLRNTCNSIYNLVTANASTNTNIITHEKTDVQNLMFFIKKINQEYNKAKRDEERKTYLATKPKTINIQKQIDEIRNRKVAPIQKEFLYD